jgi:hypothetical protein
LEYFLGALNSSSISVTSSIRLRSTQSIDPGEYLTRFLSLSFQKLSNLDIENFLPDSSSPIFTTSNLSSLKLRSPYDILPHYTLAQLSQVLHRHSDLRELDFEICAAPLIESPDAPVPFPLPQLVNLRLYATETAIAGLIDLVRMSSPLHDVTIHFSYSRGQTVPALVNVVEKVAVAYYGCQGLDFPRRANCLTISSDRWRGSLVFNAESHSTSASHPMSQLKLQFDRTDNELTERISLLLSLNHVHEFTTIGLILPTARWRGILRKMGGLLHMLLGRLDIDSMLSALDFNDQGVHNEVTEITPNRSQAHRRVVWTVRPKTEIIVAHQPRHLP